MLLAFMADIHGNQEALEAVLAEIDQAGPDRTYCLGDMVGYGPNPHECVAALRARHIPSLSGNHDRAACGSLDTNYFNEEARRSIEWTRGQLTPEDILYLQDLALVSQTELFSATHGTLLRPEDFDYVLTGEDAYNCFLAHDRRIAFVGHSHVPLSFFLREEKELLATIEPRYQIGEGMRAIVNVGSVGQPRDGNPDAAFALFDTETLGVTIRRVRYDIERTATKVRAAGLPEINALRLFVGQ